MSSLDHHKDFENVAPSLFVSQFDCSKMTENDLYSQIKHRNVLLKRLILIQPLFGHSTCINAFTRRLQDAPFAMSEKDGFVDYMAVVAWTLSNTH